MSKKQIVPFQRLRSFIFPSVYTIYSSIDEALKYADLFGSASKIHIFAGELFPEFYEDNRFLTNLRSSLNDGAEVNVIFGPALYVDNEKFLREFVEHPNLRFFMRPERKRGHYKLVRKVEGNEYLFLDQPHDINVKKDRQGLLFIEGCEEEVREYKAKFLRNQELCKEIKPESLIDLFTTNQKEKNGKYYGFIKRGDEGKVDLARKEDIDSLAKKLSAQSSDSSYYVK